MGGPTGRDWGTAARTVCCPGAWRVSKDSARAIPAESGPRDHRQLLSGCGVSGDPGASKRRTLTISGSYLKDEGIGSLKMRCRKKRKKAPLNSPHFLTEGRKIRSGRSRAFSEDSRPKASGSWTWGSLEITAPGVPRRAGTLAS